MNYHNQPKSTDSAMRPGFKLKYTFGTTLRLVVKHVRARDNAVLNRNRAILSKGQWKVWDLLTEMNAVMGRYDSITRGTLSSTAQAVSELRSYRRTIRQAPWTAPKRAINSHYVLEAYWRGSWHLIQDQIFANQPSLDWRAQKAFFDVARNWLASQRKQRREVRPINTNRRQRLLDIARSAKMPTNEERWASVEIECASKTDPRALTELMIKAGLMRFTCVKSDSSISCDETYRHAVECVVTAPISKIADIVPRVVAVLKDAGGKVNVSCGLHVHFDCRNDDKEKVYERLQRSQKLLFAAVPETRRDNRFCRPIDALTFTGGLEQAHGRYVAVNPQAYRAHRTIEVRLGSATLDPAKIVSWILLLADIAYTENVKTTRQVATLTELRQSQPTLAESTIKAIASRIQRYSPTAGQALLI